MKALAVALLLLSAALSPAVAQETDGLISGVVLDATGQPQAGQAVELRSLTGRSERLGKTTDAVGRFVFTGLRTGRYQVEASREGRVVATSQPIELSAATMQVRNVSVVPPVPLPHEVGRDVARSFEQLQLLVRPGDDVTLIDVAGTQLAGRIVEMSARTLSLVASGNRRDFREDDVITIRQRRGDPLGNGALRGFAFGAGFGLFVALVGCDSCSGSDLPLALLVIGVHGALGAGVGVGIDAAVRHEQHIYYQRPVASGGRIGIIPQIGRSRIGASVRIQPW